MPHLFCFGLGYSAGCLAQTLHREGWSISGTCRSEKKAAELRAQGYTAYLWDDGRCDVPESELNQATHLLTSISPGPNGDPVLSHFAQIIAKRNDGAWIGYLSSTAVYGDRDGSLVDETAALNPVSERAIYRVAAERDWLGLDALPVHIFRLAGIYGPGRSAFDQIRSGRARRIAKPDHLFARIHVDDIAHVLRASMAKPNPGAIYNVCDDQPAASADVIAEACRLMDVAPPPLVPFEDAVRDMSAMAKSFWADRRLIDNRRIHDELGVRLRYPTYREGLAAIHAASA